MITGSCLCGEVSYQLDETQAKSALHCHCRDCQKVTGSGKATVVFLPDDAISIEGSYSRYFKIGTDGSHVHRGFCPSCGSQLFTFVEEMPGAVFVKAGTMDDASWVNVEASCWSGSANPWSPLDTKIPHFEGNPPG
ncbi:glutathione-dependent formaldehyde-activating, GFA [Luminiphilus syltensis NOR5-1B]|uniref:Glutathione-dependent formaldehyde-activating, GFA n=1 Tax=Luminiphilus syltensis NOR5-1B TaxID=565045 RepID=B8KXI0_9GAMM|nr:GFA family protein [Luminiphilus syltensis]EED36610.1 glutathione-dependent formaldehyde-activating, GFA [Luminiphilus syltensis NOR5-1B]